MADENTKTKDKVTTWLGKNWYLLLLAVGIVGFLLTIIILASNSSSTTTTSVSGGTQEVSSQAMTFMLPIVDATISKGYSDKALQYNETLNQWEIHKAIDFTAPVGSSVCSVARGVVTDIYSNYLDGTVVVIDHGGNLKTKYASLDSEVSVSVGDTVSMGQTIGKVASTASAEAGASAHLHFEMMENDKKIDPSAYIALENK